MTDRVGQRGTSGFAVFTLMMVALFVGLGVWQLQRRVEEHALIAALNERLAAAPCAIARSLAVARPDGGQGGIPPRQLHGDL